MFGLVTGIALLLVGSARPRAAHRLLERDRPNHNRRREILSAGRRNDRPRSWWVQQPGIRRVQHERTTEMRKVTAGLFSSIDGVVEAPDQWQPAFDEEMGAVLSQMLEEQDAVLLGRVTFTEWAGYWPTSTDEPFASWINSTPKYVASTTLDSVDHWANTTLITESVGEFVADLKQQGGGTIGTAGSPTLVRSLIEHGLLDELTLMISPVVAGGGRAHLFPDDAAARSFELVEAQPTSSGALIATYRPIR
jgi:dihydrofolate reductase